MHDALAIVTNAVSHSAGPALRPACCPYCQSDVELVRGDVVYPDRLELSERHIWRCMVCDAHVGCHREGARVRRGGMDLVSDGTLPMGHLANKELRSARVEVHRLLDALWQPPARMSRGDAYAWMARTLELPQEEALVAGLDFEQCVKLMLALEDLARLQIQTPSTPDAADWLARAGIEFRVEQDGRLVVPVGEETVDYWPQTQTWSVRGLLMDEHEGLHGLILFCTQRRRR